MSSNHELKRMLEFNILLSHLILKRTHFIMATLADINTKSASILAATTAERDAIAAIATYVDGQKALLTEVKAELDAALANGDQAAIDAANANLDQALAGMSGNAAAEAAIVNTPAAPAP